MELDCRAKHYFERNDDETDPRSGSRTERDRERKKEEKRIEPIGRPNPRLYADKPFHRVMRPRLAIGVKRSVMQHSISSCLRASAVCARPLPLQRHGSPCPICLTTSRANGEPETQRQRFYFARISREIDSPPNELNDASSRRSFRGEVSRRREGTRPSLFQEEARGELPCEKFSLLSRDYPESCQAELDEERFNDEFYQTVRVSFSERIKRSACRSPITRVARARV